MRGTDIRAAISRKHKTRFCEPTTHGVHVGRGLENQNVWEAQLCGARYGRVRKVDYELGTYRHGPFRDRLLVWFIGWAAVEEIVTLGRGYFVN
jgi:hypothetical protein